MRVRFIGPIGKVTGSCTWMHDAENNWSFLVDCGMQQSERHEKNWNSGDEWPFDPVDIQFVVLTHAHVDHSGLIPELYRRGFAGKVLCTRETQEIAELLLLDAARMQESSYDISDVERIHWFIPAGKTQFGRYHPVAHNLFVRFFRSGHILGAVSVSIVWGEPKSESQRSIVFSGDVGPGKEDAESLPFLRFPMYTNSAHYAVLESTYGNVVRPTLENPRMCRRKRLQSLMKQAVASEGTLAIPSFAVGRAQDLLFDIHCVVAENPDLFSTMRFLLDSPTVRKINEITLRALCNDPQVNPNTGKVRPTWLGKQIFRDLALDDKNPNHVAHIAEICKMTLSCGWEKRKPEFQYGNSVSRNWRSTFKSVEDREKEIESPGPKLVLMTSGMADSGPAASWLPRLLADERNMIAFSGYCSRSTIGDELLRLENIPHNQRALHPGCLTWKESSSPKSSEILIRNVRAGITKLDGYSAHADQSDLVSWVFPAKDGRRPEVLSQTVFLQHGEDHARERLSDAIRNRAVAESDNVNVIMPRSGDGWFDLEGGSVE